LELKNKVIVRNFGGVLASLLLVLGMHTATAEDMDPRMAAAINERIKPVGQVSHTGQEKTAAAPAAASSATKIDAKGAYQTSCFACHGIGAAGAPILGKKDVWKPRIAQGTATLYDHALNGFKAMPARGGSSLDDATIKAVVDYMVSESK